MKTVSISRGSCSRGVVEVKLGRRMGIAVRLAPYNLQLRPWHSVARLGNDALSALSKSISSTNLPMQGVC